MTRSIGSFGAVIVTYNRIEKLKKALAAIEKQRVLPQYLIVVNNASTDGTESYLREWGVKVSPYNKIIINNEKNEGGSGGFFTGLDRAQKMDAEWIYVSDDDAYPRENAFELFESFIEENSDNNLSAICSSVFEYGEIAISHRRSLKKRILSIRESSIPVDEYNKSLFSLSLYSFVGVFLKKDKLILAGLPRKEYFIQWDDTEHSIRMGQYGSIICVPSICVDHEIEYSAFSGYQWKDYYGIRNRMDGIRRNLPSRYYLIICLKRILDLFIVWLKPDKEFAMLFSAAVFDAYRGRLGIHSVYKPGWRPGKDRKENV